MLRIVDFMKGYNFVTVHLAISLETWKLANLGSFQHTNVGFCHAIAHLHCLGLYTDILVL